jgi:Uncharacterized protein predicted to be involved in DNA repair (RAMP superfamily)
MRIELMFELAKIGEIPMDYRRIFLAFLKNAIVKINRPEYYDKYFGTTNSKDYSFTVIFEKPIFRNDVIQVEGKNMRMIFSADDKNNTGLIFMNAFIAQKNKAFPLQDGNAMILKNLRRMKEKNIINSKVIFKTMAGSGVVTRLHKREGNKDKYYVLGEEGAEKQLQYVLKEQLQNAGFRVEDAENIQVKPIQCKKVISRYYNGYIDSTVGMFEMQGKPKVLQYLYMAGMGSRHSSGYGLLDLVTQDLL